MSIIIEKLLSKASSMSKEEIVKEISGTIVNMDMSRILSMIEMAVYSNVARGTNDTAVVVELMGVNFHEQYKATLEKNGFEVTLIEEGTLRVSWGESDEE